MYVGCPESNASFFFSWLLLKLRMWHFRWTRFKVSIIYVQGCKDTWQHGSQWSQLMMCSTNSVLLPRCSCWETSTICASVYFYMVCLIEIFHPKCFTHGHYLHFINCRGIFERYTHTGWLILIWWVIGISGSILLHTDLLLYYTCSLFILHVLSYL